MEWTGSDNLLPDSDDHDPLDNRPCVGAQSSDAFGPMTDWDPSVFSQRGSLLPPAVQTTRAFLPDECPMPVVTNSTSQPWIQIDNVAWPPSPFFLHSEPLHISSAATIDDNRFKLDQDRASLAFWDNNLAADTAARSLLSFAPPHLKPQNGELLDLMTSNNQDHTRYLNDAPSTIDDVRGHPGPEMFPRSLSYPSIASSPSDEPDPLEYYDSAGTPNAQLDDKITDFIAEASSPAMEAAMFIPQQHGFIPTVYEHGHDTIEETNYYAIEHMEQWRAGSTERLPQFGNPAPTRTSCNGDLTIPKVEDDRQHKMLTQRHQRAMRPLPVGDSADCEDVIMTDQPTMSVASIKDWAKFAGTMRRLYECWTLEEIMINMHLIHGFRATPKMYKSNFHKYQIKKNQKQDGPGHARRRNARGLRHRFNMYATDGGPDRQKARFSLILNQIQFTEPFPAYLLTDPTAHNLERILYSVYVITHRCFETLGFQKDDESFHYPQGMTYSDSGFSNLKAQIDRRSWPSQDPSMDSLLDLRVPYQTLNALVMPHFDKILNCIKLFRSFQRLSETYQRPQILHTVLGYMRSHTRRFHVDNYLLDFFEALMAIEPAAINESLRIAHVKLCCVFESILGPSHPSSIEYWSIYCDVWGRDSSCPKLETCERLLKASDLRNGELSPQSIEILDSLGRMANRSPTSSPDTERLALHQVDRCRRFLSNKVTYEFSQVKRCWRNAVVLLGGIYCSTDRLEEFWLQYSNVIEYLLHGDIECVRRAANDLAYAAQFLFDHPILMEDSTRLEEMVPMAEMRAVDRQPTTPVESEECALMLGLLDGVGLDYVSQQWVSDY